LRKLFEHIETYKIKYYLNQCEVGTNGLEINNKILEMIRKIRTWDPEEDSAAALLFLCDEFDRIKPNSDISLVDWTDIKQLGRAAQYKKRVDRKASYPIWASDFEGNCIVGTSELYIEHIDEIEEKH
jgi:hypothetical protein